MPPSYDSKPQAKETLLENNVEEQKEVAEKEAEKKRLEEEQKQKEAEAEKLLEARKRWEDEKKEKAEKEAEKKREAEKKKELISKLDQTVNDMEHVFDRRAKGCVHIPLLMPMLEAPSLTPHKHLK